MSNEKKDEYIQVPVNLKKGEFIEGCKVTASFGAEMSRIVFKDPHIGKLNFPRINFPGLSCLNYTSKNYYTIAQHIKPDFIEVFEKKHESYTERGKYISLDKEHGYFLFTPSVIEFPLLEVPLYVHEITHAIQDWRKVRESRTDNEVDGWFAKALYMALAGMKAGDDPIMMVFLPVAEEFLNNKKKIKDSREEDKQNIRLLKEKRKVLRGAILQHYPEAAGESVKGFNRLRRWDGISVINA